MTNPSSKIVRFIFSSWQLVSVPWIGLLLTSLWQFLKVLWFHSVGWLRGWGGECWLAVSLPKKSTEFVDFQNGLEFGNKLVTETSLGGWKQEGCSGDTFLTNNGLTPP